MALSEILVLVLKFSFIIHLSSLSVGEPSPNINSSLEDQQALIAFKKSISDDWNALQDWNSSVAFCNWTGVTCDLARERVIELYLSGLGLQGFLSPRLGNLSSLERLDLSNNTLGSHIPPQLGRLSRLRELWLEINLLEGNIPSSLSNCRNLVNLSLSDNHLTGLIPPQLGQLTKLRRLYMNGNKLTGSIPKSLEKLGMLRGLDLSFNNLSGEIPRAGVFTNLTVTSFRGNPGLCGQWLSMPPCPTKQRDHALLKEIVIPIVSITCFILCVSLVSRFLCSRYQQKSKNTALNVGYGYPYPKISHRELIDATNGFHEANLLGVGSFGAVYKAIFRDGRMAAVKVLHLENEEAQKSFNTECKALSRVWHRNLVKIITCCSNPQFKALVLEFMPRGSLDKHLYGDSVCELKLRERVKIAIDIAHAMEYLHHYSPVQVIHCDLKPANALLDEDMTARVADFGIARITCENPMDFSTIKFKGTVGYIAPEYKQGGMVSAKGDVYSYGILLLEILTRTRPIDMFSGEFKLPNRVSMAFPERIMEVVDECLLTNEIPQQRPQMTDVVRALERIIETFVGSTWTSRFTPSSTIQDLLSRDDGQSPSSTSTSSTD
eukprot:Gb_14094 [translate_table: standard]